MFLSSRYNANGLVNAAGLLLGTVGDIVKEFNQLCQNLLDNVRDFLYQLTLQSHSDLQQ